MEDREHELPVATMRPRRLLGRFSAMRGSATRWIRARLRHLHGRHAVLLLTGVFFSAMMVCMGYVADRANRAADAIDEMQRAQLGKPLPGQVVESGRWAGEAAAEPAAEDEVEPAPAPKARDHVLFYVVGGER